MNNQLRMKYVDKRDRLRFGDSVTLKVCAEDNKLTATDVHMEKLLDNRIACFLRKASLGIFFGKQVVHAFRKKMMRTSNGQD